MTKRYSAAALAALLLSTLPAAHAALSTSTTLGNVQWNVIDLTPADGQAAGYTPLDAGHYRQVRTNVFTVAPPQDVTGFDSTTDAAASLASAQALGDAGAGANAGPGFSAAQVTAFGGASFAGGGGATANFSGGFDFTLLPHTRLEISGRVTWQGALAGDDGTPLAGRAYLLVGSVSGQEPPFPISFELDRAFSTGAPGSSGYEDFTLVYLNETDAPLTADFYVSANASVSAVPEPGEWALLLGGMGILAAWTRRRGMRR